MNTTITFSHAAPADQPTRVHQLTDRLFGAYKTDEGTVHLAGCVLEDRPFLQLDLRLLDRRRTIYLDAAGNHMDAQLVHGLGITETCRLDKSPILLAPDVEQRIEQALRMMEEQLPDLSASEEIIATVVWCKFAEGKLRFTIGENSADLPFFGWTRTLQPPAFVCPHTGRPTFHLASTDDGRIVAAESLDRCDETGRRMLSGELATCSITGRAVLPELTVICPVTQQRLLRSELVQCPACRQSVSPIAMKRNLCGGCRSLRTLLKTDPLIARLLDEHPRLRRWRSWRISKTATAYLLEASGWFRRCLFVADKDLADVKLTAIGNRLLPGWRGVEQEEPAHISHLPR